MATGCSMVHLSSVIESPTDSSGAGHAAELVLSQGSLRESSESQDVGTQALPP